MNDYRVSVAADQAADFAEYVKSLPLVDLMYVGKTSNIVAFNILIPEEDFLFLKLKYKFISVSQRHL